MTQADYIKAKLDVLKIIMSALVGASIVMAYTVQASVSYTIAQFIAIMIMGIFLIFLGKKYEKLMNELKDLP